MDAGDFVRTVFAAIVGGLLSAGAAIFVQSRQATHAHNLQEMVLRHQGEQLDRQLQDQAGRQSREWAHERAREAWRFQIDTLADVQETLSELVKRAHRAGDEQYRLIAAAPRTGPDAGKVKLTDAWREYRTQYWETRSRAIVLVVRVGDESVRTMVNELLENADRLGKDSPFTTNLIQEMRKDGQDMGPDPDRESPELLFRINRRIGELMRTDQPDHV